MFKVFKHVVYIVHSNALGHHGLVYEPHSVVFRREPYSDKSGNTVINKGYEI